MKSPVHGLNIVGVIVPPGAAHATGTDVVGDHVAVIGELLFADALNGILSRNLAVQQLAHLPIGAQLAVSARMLGIVDAANAHLAWTSFPRDCLPSTAGEGAVDWTELVLAESHRILLVDGKVIDGLGNYDCWERKYGVRWDERFIERDGWSFGRFRNGPPALH